MFSAVSRDGILHKSVEVGGCMTFWKTELSQFYRKLEFVSRPNELNRSCEHAGGVNQLSLLISRSPRLKPAAHIICLHAEQVRPQTHDIGKVWNTWYYTESIIIIFDFPEQSVIISDRPKHLNEPWTKSKCLMGSFVYERPSPDFLSLCLVSLRQLRQLLLLTHFTAHYHLPSH